jgi:metal-dependent HD superfamily phosphatase/phosphodiesterase
MKINEEVWAFMEMPNYTDMMKNIFGAKSGDIHTSYSDKQIVALGRLVWKDGFSPSEKKSVLPGL